MRFSFQFALLLMPVLFHQQVLAQTEIADKDRAVIAFDFRYDRIRENEIVQENGLQELAMEEFQSEIGPIAINKVIRIFGSISVPGSLEQLMGMEPGDQLPFNFFVQIKFADEESVADFLGGVNLSDTIEKDGKTHYVVPAGEGPANLVMHTPDPTTVELGTDTYLYSGNRKLFTQSLSDIWAKLPNHAVRIAVDLEGARNFVDQAVEAANENLPSEAGMFLDLISSTSTLRLSVDLEGEDLLSLVATGNDEESTHRLQGGLEALLGMARFGGKSMIGELAEEDPDTAQVAAEILAALKTSKSGNDIALTIPKPDGFSAAVTRTMTRVEKTRDALEVKYNFMNYGLGVHYYHDTFSQLPFTPVTGTPMSEDLSWRVRILPFIEQQQLYERMNIEEAHDSETNQQFADQMPLVYGSDGKTTEACWIKPEKMPKTFANITDGMSNTIMLIQNPHKVAWTQPIDITPKEAVAAVKGLMDGQELIVVFYDGHISQLTNEVDEETLSRLFDPADGKPVDFE